MTKRKKVPSENETEVLTRSRRRCCICYGLSRDNAVKQGQVAHLDQDPSNTSEENLAFLCLEHHDQYDSRTSQSKGLQISEVKAYRTELYKHFVEGLDLSSTDTGAEQPDWELLSPSQKNAILFDRPYHCAFCGYSYMLTPRLKPNENVYVRVAKCPSCGNVEEVSRFYEA
jgi:hypothetical protein